MRFKYNSVQEFEVCSCITGFRFVFAAEDMLAVKELGYMWQHWKQLKLRSLR